MKKVKKHMLLYVFLFVFILSNIPAGVSIMPVNAEESTEVQAESVQAIRGIPELISKPATQEDIDYINCASYSKSSISFRQLPLLESSRIFTAYNPTTDTYDEISFTLKRIGEHSYIYLEDGNQEVTDTMLNNIVSRFESIYDENIYVFGTPPDIDKDKRINILLMDIRDSGSYSYIAGFFDSVNQLPSIYNPESNESEVFYMDVNEGLPDSRRTELDFYGTLAHEFQHMIQYGTYLRNYTSNISREETWLNEALSCLAEYINLDVHPEGQVEEFLADNFTSGDGLIDWDPSGNLANYGASYMFALYMYENFGRSFITDLSQDTETGIQSIENQLIAHGENIDFDELFERFQVAAIVGTDYMFGFSDIDTAFLRGVSYESGYSGDYHPDMKFNSYMGWYSGEGQYTITTNGGAYRGFAVFLGRNNTSGSLTTGTLKLNFTNDSGTYYIVKPSDIYSTANSYDTFMDQDKMVEEIQPDLVNGNVVELGPDHWALLIYIAKDSPIVNYVTVTEVDAPTATGDEKPSTPVMLPGTASYNNITLNWEPSNYIYGIQGYNIYRDSAMLTEYPIMATTYTDLSVNAERTYEYQVQAVGWDSKLSDLSVAEAVYTGVTPDIIAPGAPSISYLGTTSDGSSADIQIRLTAPEGFPDVDHYEVIPLLDGMEDNGVFSNVASAGNLNLTGFIPESMYTIYAYAVDSSGNYSPASNKLYVKAGAGPAAMAAQPTAPTGVTASAVKETKIGLRWTASSQAEGILEYNIYRNGVFVGKTAGSAVQYTDSGLTGNTSYTYTIEAVGNDADNLNSEYSTPLSVTTASGPPVITADSTANSTNNNLVLTFNDNAIWRNSISQIKLDGTAISESRYSISSGTVTIYSGTIPSGDHTITFIADGFSNTQVVQTVTAAPTPSSGGGSSGGGGSGSSGGGSISTGTSSVPSASSTSLPGETVVTVSALGSQINSTASDTVSISTGKTGIEHTVVLPKNVLGTLSDKHKNILINADEVSMSFSPDLSDLGKDSSLKIEIKKLDSGTLANTLSGTSAASSKALLRLNKNIYQFDAKVSHKEKTTALTSFNKDISITISLKDADLSKIDADKLGVYYFNEKFKSWEYVGGKYDPITKSITFKTNHFSYYTVMTYDKSFNDINGHWAQADIEKLAAKHIFRNIAEEKFNPNDKVTRAEFIAMLVRTLELKSTSAEPVAFKDIVEDKYYYGEVMTAWKLGITNGDDTGKLRPGDNITREQLAAMISRALNYLNKSPNLSEAQINEKLNSYTDKDKVSSFARNAMAIALEKKIINGWTQEMLAPKENATRAEAAVMIRRLLSGL